MFFTRIRGRKLFVLSVHHLRSISYVLFAKDGFVIVIRLENLRSNGGIDMADSDTEFLFDAVICSKV